MSNENEVLSTYLDRIIRDEVLCNVSMLIDDLNTLVSNADRSVVRELSFYEDDLMSLLSRQDYDEAVEDYIYQLSMGDVVDYLEEVAGLPCLPSESLKELRHAMWIAVQANDAEAFAREYGIEAHCTEVLEHWAVSKWLAKKLEGEGEVVVQVSNLWVWGRCTSGQAIIMDGVIQRIARSLM